MIGAYPRLNPAGAKRFMFVLASGEVVTGPVHGAGGPVGTIARLNAARRMALMGRSTGIVEPEPGCVAVYPDFCAWSDGPMRVVSLLTSTWTEEP